MNNISGLGVSELCVQRALLRMTSHGKVQKGTNQDGATEKDVTHTLLVDQLHSPHACQQVDGSAMAGLPGRMLTATGGESATTRWCFDRV